MKIRFACPECGELRLEEVLGMATVTTTVQEVTTTTVGGNVMIELHGTPAIEDGDVIQYACSACGHQVAHEDGTRITDPAELLAWLQARGMVEDSTS